MKKFGLVAAVAAPLLFGFAHAAPPPVEAFARLPAIAHPAISPDGTKLAVIQDLGEQRAVVIYDLVNGGSGGVQLGDVLGLSLAWANNDRILVWISKAKRFRYSQTTYQLVRILSMNTKGEDFKYLFSNNNDFQNQVGAGGIISWRPDDPKTILMEHYGKPHFKYNAYAVNVETGRAVLDEEARDGTEYWVAGPAGEIRMRVDYDDAHDREVFWHRGGDRGNLEVVASLPREDGKPGVFSPYGFGSDGLKLYGIARAGADRDGLYQFNWNGAGDFTNIFTPDDVDIDDVIIDPYTTTVIGASFTEDMPEQNFLDAELAKRLSQLKQAFPGADVAIHSWSRDRMKYIVVVEPVGKPPQYILFDAGKMSTSVIGDTYPELAKAPLGTVERYDYTAPDGLVIHGYLTIPPGAEKENLPLIVLPHGGPAGRDDMEFDWWREYFATRGYAVYQPNFRGSSGYGYDFEHAGDGEWGAKMQSDITNGVRKLISEGTVDSSRICIVGASYGGYAALAGAAFTPDLYACAASVNGVSDLGAMFAFFKSQTGDNKSEIAQYFEQTMGSSVTDTAFLRSRSPHQHVDSIRAPVLLLHSENDLTVPNWQSKIMKDALEQAGKPVTLVTLDGDDHYLRQAKTRAQMLEAVGKFVNQQIGRR